MANLKRLLAQHGIASPYDSLDSLPTIYAVTPTHTRPLQKAELTRYLHKKKKTRKITYKLFFSFRISQTFSLVPNFHWIVVEDSEHKTSLVANLLAKSGVAHTHLNAATPKEWKLLLSVSWNFISSAISFIKLAVMCCHL